MNKYDEGIINKFGKAARSFDRPPVVLSLKEQLLKCGTPTEKTMIRRKDLEAAAAREKEIIQQYETAPDMADLSN